MSNIRLYNKDEQEINLDSLGLLGLKLIVPSPSYSRETETLEDMPGEVVIEKRLNPKTLVAEFWARSQDYESSLRARDELYGILGNGEMHYVSEAKQQGKRFKFHADGWEPDRINSRTMAFSIPMFVPSGMAESVKPAQRTFSEPLFLFENEGTAKINMRHQTETEIEFRGASTDLTIHNRTTGETWTYDGSTAAEDLVLLKGVRATKNGSSIFGSTNKKLLSFAPGWNEIEVAGAADFTIEIRTRFYFL